jgi:hypothetical protein
MFISDKNRVKSKNPCYFLWWLPSVRFKYKPGYKSLVEITAFRLEKIFQPMRALQFITGYMVYNLAYT